MPLEATLGLGGDELAAYADAVAGTWSRTDELLALLVYRLNMLAWGLGGGKGQRPEPIRKPPPERVAEGEAVTPEAYADWYASLDLAPA